MGRSPHLWGQWPWWASNSCSASQDRTRWRLDDWVLIFFNLHVCVVCHPPVDIRIDYLHHFRFYAWIFTVDWHLPLNEWLWFLGRIVRCVHHRKDFPEKSPVTQCNSVAYVLTYPVLLVSHFLDNPPCFHRPPWERSLLVLHLHRFANLKISEWVAVYVIMLLIEHVSLPWSFLSTLWSPSNVCESGTSLEVWGGDLL